MNAAIVKELRDKTNAGMMDCKQALVEANGDLEEAIQVLRKKGISKAAKKADRDANEGLILALVSDDGQSGTLVEVNCETDFVARNDDFNALVTGIANDVLAADASEISEDGSLSDALTEVYQAKVTAAVSSLGENLGFKRAFRYNTAEGVVGSYIHLGGRIGVLAEFAGSDANQDEIMKDICLHIAASAPSYLTRDDVSEDDINKEKDVMMAQLKGKPENIMEKIIEGKLNKFYSEICLIEQGFVKDPDRSVKDVLGGLSIVRFSRFQLGA